MSGRRRRIFLAVAIAAALCCGAVASGCGGGEKKKTVGASTTNLPTSSAKREIPKPKAKKKKARQSKAPPGPFDPSNFDNPAKGRNTYDPMIPGRQSVREGLLNIGHRRVSHRRVYTITDVTKEIDGVRTVIALDQDFNGGQLGEQAIDFHAEDKQGNLWYLGSYTETYEGGQFVNATDGWLAGVNGAKPGVYMAAYPRVGESYFEATSIGEPGPPSRVLKAGTSKCVPFKCYKDVLIIAEGGGSEWKYYAPGVGGILTEPHYSGGEQEVERLINFTQLSSHALAGLSDEALKVEKHARSVFPSVYGTSSPAKRGL